MNKTTVFKDGKPVTAYENPKTPACVFIPGKGMTMIGKNTPGYNR